MCQGRREEAGGGRGQTLRDRAAEGREREREKKKGVGWGGGERHGRRGEMRERPWT